MSLDRYIIKQKRKADEKDTDTKLDNQEKQNEKRQKLRYEEYRNANKPDEDKSSKKSDNEESNNHIFFDAVDIHNGELTEQDLTRQLKWRKLKAENLDSDYVVLYSRREADDLMRQCENTIVYNTGQLAQVQIFGKWLDIKRKQVAFGDPGLTYTFSGNTVPAKPWIPLLEGIRDKITDLTGHHFNFVLINRYKDGHDYMGEHKDDEKDLTPGHPIASLSLGQPREFIFKHQDTRGKNAKRTIDLVKIELGHGSLLLMNYPTNEYWYHSLPARKKLINIRINMTFRKMVPSACKPCKHLKL